MKLAKETKTRSTKQNAMYWGFIIPQVCNSTGLVPEQAHESMALKFIPKIDMRTGLLLGRRSTTELSTVEFKKYIEDIEDWIQEQNHDGQATHRTSDHAGPDTDGDFGEAF